MRFFMWTSPVRWRMPGHGFGNRMNARPGSLEYTLALKSIAARYCGPSDARGYRTDCATAFLTAVQLRL